MFGYWLFSLCFFFKNRYFSPPFAQQLMLLSVAKTFISAWPSGPTPQPPPLSTRRLTVPAQSTLRKPCAMSGLSVCHLVYCSVDLQKLYCAVLEWLSMLLWIFMSNIFAPYSDHISFNVTFRVSLRYRHPGLVWGGSSDSFTHRPVWKSHSFFPKSNILFFLL